MIFVSTRREVLTRYTHTFIWFVEGDTRLSETAQALIAEPSNEISVSTASLWEMAIKVSIGKLNFSQPFDVLIPSQLATNDMTILDISLNHLFVVTQLPFHHRDPFDRLLIAQSLVDNLPLIGIDGMFDSYGVNRMW